MNFVVCDTRVDVSLNFLVTKYLSFVIMSATTSLQILVLSIFLLASFFGVEGKIPDSCKKYECPSYDVTEVGKDYEIRRYNSPVWI